MQITFYVSRLHSIRVLIVVVLCLPVLSLLPPIAVKAMPGSPSPSDETSKAVVYTENNPNVVSEGMISGVAELSNSLGSISDSAVLALYSVASTSYNGLRNVGIFATTSVKVVGKSIGIALVHTTKTVVKGTVSATKKTGNIVGSMAKAPSAGSYVRPAENAPTPEIDAQGALVKANEIKVDVQKQKESTPHSNNGVIWPTHGTITTYFGVPEWPYQPIHTGVDISSGQPSGVTSIRAYRSGRVAEVIHSAYSLGNHVIIDHGNGLKSVYAHMSVISVSTGQEVVTGAILGKEGSTGASTGPHLHFEIRQNGQPLNPQQFISGQP